MESPIPVVLLSAEPLHATSILRTSSNVALIPAGKALLSPSPSPTSPSTSDPPKDALAQHLQRTVRTFVDELNDDLVVILLGEVCFSTISLAAEGAPPPPAAASRGDAVHLRTKNRTIYSARRTRTPAGKTLVAVAHNSNCVHIYVPRRYAQDPKETPETDPFAAVQCSPNPLRFGWRVAEVRAFFWIAREEAATGAVAASSHSQQNSAVLLLACDVDIDIVAISPEPDGPAVQRLRRIDTHTDYCCFHRPTRLLISINSQKPQFIKPYYMEPSGQQLNSLTKIKLDESSELRAVPASASQMHPPMFSSLVQPMRLYDRVYIAHLSISGELVLFQWKSSSKASSPIERHEAGPDGSFEKTHVLTVAPCRGYLKPISLVVVDNMIVAIQSENMLFAAAFDVRAVDDKGLIPKARSSSSLEGRQSPTEQQQQQQQQQQQHAGWGNTALTWWKGFTGQSTSSSVAVVESVVAPGPMGIPECASSLWNPPESRPLHRSVPPEQVSSCCFYNSSLPLMLNRATGEVRLVLVDPKAMAASCRPLSLPRTVKLLMNRTGMGGDCIPTLLRELIQRREPVSQLCELVDIVATFNEKRVPSSNRGKSNNRKLCPFGQLPAPFYRIVGSLHRLADVFPILGADHPHTFTLADALVSFEEAPGKWRATFDQQEFYTSVLVPQLDYLAKLPSTEATKFAGYLLSIIMDYCRSLMACGRGLLPVLQRTLIELFLEPAGASSAAQFYQLQQAFMYRAIEDHVVVALQLVKLAGQYPAALQLGFDMLFRLKADRNITEVYLAQGQPLQAAHFVLFSGLQDAPVLEVMRCAAAIDDQQSQSQSDDRRRGTGVEHATYCVVFQMMRRWLEVQRARKDAQQKLPSEEEWGPFQRKFEEKLEMPAG